MKNLSIKKWSVLGLVLLGASAVTAAILPANKNTNDEPNCNGVATDTADATFTCRAAKDADGSFRDCFSSAPNFSATNNAPSTTSACITIA